MINSHIDIEKDHQYLEKIDLLKDSWKFVPKHLMVVKNQEKKGIHGGILRKLKDKDALYEETTLQIINKNKNLYLTPVRDIQEIMKHFNKKFSGYGEGQIQKRNLNFKLNNKSKRKVNRKRIKTSMQTHDQQNQYNRHQLIENKITKILQLPTIKRAVSEAKKIKNCSYQNSQKKENQKKQILKKFQIYFNKQLNLLNKSEQNVAQRNFKSKNQRIKTSLET